jgi:pilus assembly protein Flp/PilA
MTSYLSRFLSDNDGATAIEYALIAAGIALAIIATVNSLGSAVLNNQFNLVKNALSP